MSLYLKGVQGHEAGGDLDLGVQCRKVLYREPTSTKSERDIVPMHQSTVHDRLQWRHCLPLGCPEPFLLSGFPGPVPRRCKPTNYAQPLSYPGSTT